MRLWHFTRPEAYEALRAQGELTANAERVYTDFLEAYDWMAAQMRLRIGLPPKDVQYPIWAWKQWDGKARPDLRFSGHLERGASGVLLEIEVPENMALLSDFEDWHMVLNRGFHALSEDEDRSFEKALAAVSEEPGWPLPEPFHTRVLQSWERIFDLDQSCCCPHWRGSPEARSIQAVFWRLEAGMVKSAKPFIAK